MKMKRIGRGMGSGKGSHTVGRGQKGQRSRSGGAKGGGFEGGNRPLFSRLPKFRGFRNPNRVVVQPVNLSELEKHFDEGEKVTLAVLKAKGMIKKQTRHAKILGKGVLKKKLMFTGVTVSANAKKQIEQVGGDVK